LPFLYMAGHDLQAAAGLVGMSGKAAGRTLPLFETEGVAALRDVPRPGRAPVLGSEAWEQIQAVLRQSPREQGHATNNWTGPLLRDYLIKTYQVTLSVY
jgi:transposase